MPPAPPRCALRRPAREGAAAAGAAVTVVRPAGGAGRGGTEGQRLSGSPEAGAEPARAGSASRGRVFRARGCGPRGVCAAPSAARTRRSERALPGPAARLRESAPPRPPLCLRTSLLLWLPLLRMSRLGTGRRPPQAPARRDRQRCGK